MRKIFNIVLSLLLVLPVVAVAMPCNMQMDMQAVESSPMMNGDMPCMNHEAKVMEACDNVMSMADCYDLELISSVDKVKIPAVKVDVSSLDIFAEGLYNSAAQASVKSRAPPVDVGHTYSQLPVILITQRYRV